MARIILLVLVALVAVLVAAVRYLPWWGVLLTLAGEALALYVAFRFAFQRILASLFMIPFKAKGAVLRGATAEVHAIEDAEAPPEPQDPDEVDDKDEEGSEVEAPRRPTIQREYYRLEVTITPRPSSGKGFQHWAPGELMLVPSNAKVHLDSDDRDNVGPSNVEILQDGRFAPDEGMKYFGPQRLRVLFGLELGAPRRLKFRYYFETFGDFHMPDATPRTP